MKDKINLIVVLTFIVLAVYGCNFRLEHLKTPENNVNQDTYFDTYPPNPMLISPSSPSVISGRVLFIGRTYDNSSTTTYVSFGLSNLVFSNSSDWAFEANTYDLTNGPFLITVYAEDSLKNRSEMKIYRYDVSNSLEVILSYKGLVITNTNFLVSIYISSTNYLSLKLYTNNHLYIDTNSIKNIMLELKNNTFEEYKTNTLLVTVDEITNKLDFVFDLSPPSISVALSSNSYIYGSSFGISIIVVDTNSNYTFLVYGGTMNVFNTTNGTNSVLVNTFMMNNGTNIISFQAKDIAGNVSSSITIPLIVANFYLQELNVSSSRYYFVNSEIVSNKIHLLFTTEDFSSAFVSREENNFQREKVKQSIDLSPGGKMRTIYDGNRVILGYINSSDNLIIRTNHQITNYYQSANMGLVRDFELCLLTNRTFVLRLTQSGYLVITDISNKITNFITNLLGGALIGVDKYPIDRLFYSVSKDNTLMLFTNNHLFFTTNLSDISRTVLISLSNNFHYCSIANTNRIEILVFSNFSLVTNYIFNGRFKDICVSRVRNGSVFYLVEEVETYTDSVRVVEFDGGSVMRNQLLSHTFFSYAFWKDSSLSIIDQQINIFVPTFYSNIGRITRFTGL